MLLQPKVEIFVVYETCGLCGRGRLMRPHYARRADGADARNGRPRIARVRSGRPDRRPRSKGVGCPRRARPLGRQGASMLFGHKSKTGDDEGDAWDYRFEKTLAELKERKSEALAQSDEDGEPYKCMSKKGYPLYNNEY